MRISDWSSDVCSSDLHHFLGYADQASPSLIYRWDGAKFVPYQTFSETGGRAFLHFTREGEHWLAFTDIVNASTLCRWNGELFVAHQQLGAGGAREFQIIEKANALFLVKIGRASCGEGVCQYV